ncbi:MAG TPA: SPOR domain-containing protein [Longimicrobiales bacterium]
MMRTLALLALGVIAPAALAAQPPSLDEAEQLIARGEYAAARALLERWWREEPAANATVAPTARPRALLLRARLATDPAAAEQDYLALTLGHPSSPEAAEALLRLGQGLLASGQPPRAIVYLERLARDHPLSPHRALGLLWLARARRAAGLPGPACEAVTEAAALGGSSPGLADLIRSEQVASCRRIPDEPRPARPQRQGAGRAAPQAGARRAPAGQTDGAAFAAQAGAFRDSKGAQALAAQLRSAGFEPRVVRIAGSRLFRVRVGRFNDAAEAEALAARLRAAGFPAFVVRDAARELPPP